MARSNSPSDSWGQLYQQSLPPATATSSITGGVVSDSTIVSASQSTAGAGLHGSRPIRRRSRASRRTPTTVLNTDPTNFRAMVQQFTGGYANTTSPYPVPVGSSILTHPAAPSFINFGVGDRARQSNVSSEMAYRQFLQIQLQQQQQHQQQQQQQQQHQHRPRLNGQGSDDAFLMQRIRNFGSDVENNEHFGH